MEIQSASLDRSGALTAVRAVSGQIQAEYADLIQAVELGGESPDVMAGRLGITSNNLKVRRHRARQALRRKLEETCRTCADHGCLDCTCGKE